MKKKVIKLNESKLKSVIRETLSEYSIFTPPWEGDYDYSEPESDTFKEKMSSYTLLRGFCDLDNNEYDASGLDYYKDSGILPPTGVIEIEYSYNKELVGRDEDGFGKYEHTNENIEGIVCYFIGKDGNKMTFDELIQYLSTLRMKGIGTVIDIVKCAKKVFEEMLNEGYSLGDWESFIEDFDKFK